MSFTLQQTKMYILSFAIILGFAINCTQARAQGSQTAVVAGGCFWCVESDFESVRGVSGAVSGFTGGSVANPTYKQVTRGGTGHYEAVQIRFNANQVSFAQLMRLFFRSIDPTDAGGQFCDRGNSYRTAIFYANSAQRQAAEAAKSEAQAALGRRIVTPILPLAAFYPADDSHQNYYRGNNRVVTRFGVKRQAEAYKAYRNACGRDARVRQLWGSDAPFIGH